MKKFQNTPRTNKVMFVTSLVLFISAGVILGVRALTIDTSILNTMQIIKRIVISNNHSTADADVLVDLNNDANGTVYIKHKLGIGDSTPSSALQVSGNIIANQYCDTNGGICSTIANMIGGTVMGTGSDGYLSGVVFDTTNNTLTFDITGHSNITTNLSTLKEYSTGTNGKICTLSGSQIACNTDPANGGVDTNNYLNSGSFNTSNGTLTLGVTGQSDITINLDGRYITGYTEADPIFLVHSGDYYTTGEADAKYLNSSLRDTGTNSSISYLSGNVGIGTGTPTEKLTVSGNVLANAFLYPSDRRLKTNIQALAPALDKIRQINPYSFDRKSNGQSSIGFIAQEMENIYPILVHTNSNGIKSINYVNMVVPLTQAVKELDAENQKLKAEIAEIKAMLHNSKL